MVKKRRGERRKNKLEIKVVIIFLVLALVSLLVLLFFDFNLPGKIHNIFYKQPPIVIKGQCYAAFNTVLYQISNEDDCQKQCTDTCWVDKKQYKSSQFVLTPGSCNLCDCYCK